MIPKFHGEKLTDIPDEYLNEVLVCSHPPGTVLALNKVPASEDLARRTIIPAASGLSQAKQANH